MSDFDQAILDLVEHPVFVLEPDQNGDPVYVAFNAHGCGALNKQENEIIGLTAAQLYPGRLGSIAFDHHCRVLRTGATREYEILLPILGRKKLVHTVLRPICDDTGKVIRIIGTSTDISSKQFFREVQSQIETKNFEMEDFFSISAYGSDEPVRQLEQISALLREDFQDMGDGKLELIGVLEDMCEKSITMIGDLLTYANTESKSDQNAKFELSTLVQEIMVYLDKTGELCVDYGAGQVTGDRTATQIALKNLLDHAIRHASKTARSDLKLSVAVAKEDGDMFRVSVRDNGVGFDQTSIEFFKGAALQDEKHLGLLAIRRLILARGGHLRADHDPDEGTTELSFTLPGSVEPAGLDFPAGIPVLASTDGPDLSRTLGRSG